MPNVDVFSRKRGHKSFFDSNYLQKTSKLSYIKGGNDEGFDVARLTLTLTLITRREFTFYSAIKRRFLSIFDDRRFLFFCLWAFLPRVLSVSTIVERLNVDFYPFSTFVASLSFISIPISTLDASPSFVFYEKLFHTRVRKTTRRSNRNTRYS